MARDRIRNVRALQSGVDSGLSAWQLESRLLLSRVAVRPAAVARLQNTVSARSITGDGLPSSPEPYVQTGVVNGGLAAGMIDTDGEFYVAHLVGGGTVRAKAAPKGQVDLFLYGTNNNSVLTIDPETPTPARNSAHDFPKGSVHQDRLLHIRNITVTNGRMNQILGYKTADISGAIKVVGKGQPGPSVDRIAFFALQPGASVEVFGNLNTLEIYDTINLNTGPGIRVGRDLNWFNVGSNLTLSNGASIIAGRDIGLAPQGAKGSGLSGQGGLIQGNLVVGTGSTIAPVRYIDANIIVQGSSLGISNLPANVQAATIVYGTRA